MRAVVLDCTLKKSPESDTGRTMAANLHAAASAPAANPIPA